MRGFVAFALFYDAVNKTSVNFRLSVGPLTKVLDRNGRHVSFESSI